LESIETKRKFLKTKERLVLLIGFLIVIEPYFQARIWVLLTVDKKPYFLI